VRRGSKERKREVVIRGKDLRRASAGNRTDHHARVLVVFFLRRKTQEVLNLLAVWSISELVEIGD
jgi:hypothetical protein